jgi:hypothetical protein
MDAPRQQEEEEEQDRKASMDDDSDAVEPVHNYRGWKAMPYVIGDYIISQHDLSASLCSVFACN